MHSHQHVDCRIVCIERHNLDKSLLVLFTNALDNERPVPNKKIPSICAGNCHLFIRNENSLCEFCFRFLLSTEVLFLDSWRVVLKCGHARLPRQEENSLLTIRGYFLRISRIEFNPVLIFEIFNEFEL